MLLRDYCIALPGGYEALAEMAGEHRGTIWKIAHGRCGFTPAKGLKICEATGGAVSMAELAAPFDQNFVMPPAPEGGGAVPMEAA